MFLWPERCRRKRTLVGIDWPTVKLVSLHVVSLQVAVSENLARVLTRLGAQRQIPSSFSLGGTFARQS